jgi:hypothetical protein
MSARNGDKSRHQVNRKRSVLRREKARELLAGKGGQAAAGPKRRIKPPTGT